MSQEMNIATENNKGRSFTSIPMYCLSALTGYIGVAKLLDSANAKAVCLEMKLEGASKLTSDIYESVNDTIPTAAQKDSVEGLLLFCLAGVIFGAASYCAAKYGPTKKE